ncbi:MAG: hypothetical protein ACYC3I_20880 [Gemmataceae bacterium]
MNERCGLWLLLALSLLLPPRISAAQPRSRVAEPPKQSHHDLPGGIDLDNPQEMLAQRLQQLRQRRQLQDQVQSLLKDPKILDRVKKQFSEEDLRHLMKKMSKGLGQDGDWERLLQQAGSGQKLDRRQIDLLLRSWDGLLKREELKLPTVGEFSGMMPDPAKPDPPSSPSTPTADFSTPPTLPAPPSVFERLEADTTKWVMENLDEFGSDALEALTQAGKKEEGAPFAELLRSLRQHDFSGLHPGEPALELSRHLPNVGDFFHRHAGAWGEARSLFRGVKMPHLGSPSVSVPLAVAADGDTWATGLLALLMLGAIVLFLCKAGLGAATRFDAGEEWRLGPWPVPPDGVSTRQDVIRAFEHLVLLCLGPAASACHHRALAERLAELDRGNPARRQAAETLAWLYEQARYAPAGESLSQCQLIDARHALCFLAGVTTA